VRSIFRTPPEHRGIVSRARMSIQQSRKLLDENSSDSFAGIAHAVRSFSTVRFDETGLTSPTESRATVGRDLMIELIELTDKMLQYYGRDIEVDDRAIHCFVIAEFVVVADVIRPDATLYRVLLRDDEENVSQAFAAISDMVSGTPGLQLYRDGAWEKKIPLSSRRSR
jgi:hypothetical protein